MVNSSSVSKSVNKTTKKPTLQSTNSRRNPPNLSRKQSSSSKTEDQTELKFNVVSSARGSDSINKDQETNIGNTIEATLEPEEGQEIYMQKEDSKSQDDCLLEKYEKDDSLPDGWEEHEDNSGPYYWHIATGTIQRVRPSSCLSPRRESYIFYHDDEEINQPHKIGIDGLDNTEDLTASDHSFVVYPVGNCEFDETQLTSATSSKAIQRCIQQLSLVQDNGSNRSWCLDQSKPILMKIHNEKILFFNLENQQLIFSQSIATIKVWAVNDDNDFAYVVEDTSNNVTSSNKEPGDEDALLSSEVGLMAPNLRCYVFRSLDDDEMNTKVADILNKVMTRIKEPQQRLKPNTSGASDDVEVYPCEHAMIAKYLGRVQLSRPSGIDMLNSAIDKCVAECEKLEQQLPKKDCEEKHDEEEEAVNTDCMIHISPSSVIVESCSSGNIIVECRIRFLTFMGISKRDVKWYGFVMQTTDNKFEAHCFECLPSAGPVCSAIQEACTKMYKKVVQNHEPVTISSGRMGSIKIALKKTFSKIRLGAEG